MQRSIGIVAGLLIVAGTVFAAQGLGLLRSNSAMTDDVRWAVIGALMVAGGLVLAVRAWRGRPA